MLLFADLYGKRMSDKDRNIVKQMFTHFGNLNNYYTVLQYIYNNGDHFSTIGNDHNICTFEKLFDLYKKFKSPKHILVVQGSIHTNSHSSNIVLDTIDMKPVFCEDTYIKLIDMDDSKHHLLVLPPIVSSNKPVLVMQSNWCDKIPYTIMPILK